MQALAAFIMRSRVHAGGVAALLLLGGWLFAPLMPLLSVLSGGAVGLASLRKGTREGLAVIAVATGIAAAAAWAGFGTPVPGLVMAPCLWLPVWLCAMVLRYTRSQGALLFGIGVIAALFAGGLRLSAGDVTALWRTQLHAMLALAEDKANPVLGAEALERLASMMNSIMAASVVVSLMMVVLLARWWQALLYNPGGFGREFRGLRLPRLPMLAATAVLLGLIAWSGLQPAGAGSRYTTDLLVILSTLYAFQGLAVAHDLVAIRNLGWGWLFGLYVLLLVQAIPAALVLVVTGLADSLMNRRRPDPAGGSRP